MLPPLITYTELLTLRANDPSIELSTPIDIRDDDGTVVTQAHLLYKDDDPTNATAPVIGNRSRCVAWFVPAADGDIDAKLLDLAAKEIQQIVGPRWRP